MRAKQALLHKAPLLIAGHCEIVFVPRRRAICEIAGFWFQVVTGTRTRYNPCEMRPGPLPAATVL